MGAEQRIRFFTTAQAVRIAYSVTGDGPPVVRTPPWLSHLDLEWQALPIRDFYESIARHHALVRYDSHGCGLSDRERDDFSLESEIRLLEAVADNLDLERFALLGIGAGGPVAISYAAMHPERVSNLILYGTFCRSLDVAIERKIPEPIETLMFEYWDLSTRLLATMNAPSADGATLQVLASMYQNGASGCNAVRATHGLLYGIDVTPMLAKLQVPSTVIHRIGDPVFPYQAGRELAARMPSSWFVPLEGDAHVPFFGDSGAVLAAIARALGDTPEQVGADSAEPGRENRPNQAVTPEIDASSIELPWTLGSEVGSGAAALHALAPVSSVADRIENGVIFRREGEYWTIAYRGDTFRIKDSRGMRYLEQLLRYPGRQFHASELEIRSEASDVSDLARRGTTTLTNEELKGAGLHSDSSADAGEVLDANAKKAYRRRLDELHEALRHAKERGDVEQGCAIEEEISFIAHELARAVGLGGRDRRAASATQKSRLNVTRAIRRAIDKIQHHSPALGGILAVRIKTGVLCLYREDSRNPIKWQW